MTEADETRVREIIREEMAAERERAWEFRTALSATHPDELRSYIESVSLLAAQRAARLGV